jgi:hypothetical protein
MNKERLEEKVKEDKVARREHVVTDQGNGGSYCDHCNYDLGSDAMRDYDSCPGCGYKLIEGSIWISPGGSDF